MTAVLELVGTRTGKTEEFWKKEGEVEIKVKKTPEFSMQNQLQQSKCS